MVGLANLSILRRAIRNSLSGSKLRFISSTKPVLDSDDIGGWEDWNPPVCPILYTKAIRNRVEALKRAGIYPRRVDLSNKKVTG